ncbi:MAG: methyltransferase domain-containing protein [Acidobacteriota bacterium]|nr:methyltransferase domain-containing protein [Acidobacteriota bacterium]
MMGKTYRYCRIDRRGCVHCGCRDFGQEAVIDDPLAAAWELSDRERRRLDQREGNCCRNCGMSKRVRMLLWSIRRRCPPGPELRILHLNQTNALAPALERLGSVTETVHRPDRPLGSQVDGRFNEDMSRLTFEGNRFDLAVHSETLEHLLDYGQALDEVRRVLKPGGIQVYTIPLLFSRVTRQRMTRDASGRLVSRLPPSFHGCDREFPVIWEFGGDYIRQRGARIREIHFDNYWRNRTVFTLIEGKEGV